MHLPIRILSFVVSFVLAMPLMGWGNDPDEVDNAARRFRIRTYESYRTDRVELDRRLQLGEQILEGWRKRRFASDEIPSLVKWFKGATRMSRIESRDPLPAYSFQPAAPEASISQATEIPAGATADPKRHGVQSRRDHQASAARAPAANGDEARTETRPGPRRGRLRRREVPDDLPPRAAPDVIPQRPQIARTIPDETLPLIRLHKNSPKATSLDRRPTSPGDAAFSGPRPRRLTTMNAAAFQLVDYDVLAAKIRSLNLSLAAIEGELVEHTDMNVDGLEATVRDLIRLIDAADLMQIYYDAIPAEPRKQLESITDSKPVQALLAQRVFEARVRLTDDSATDESVGIDDRLARLDRISQEMNRWTTRLKE